MLNGLWNKISHLGISQVGSLEPHEIKRLIFFNQVLFVGMFATVFQIPMVWPFIGVKSLAFIAVCFFLLGSLLLNRRGYFAASKWHYGLVIYSFGTMSTLFLGGAALYHLQAVLIFISCLILFDGKKERLQILAGIPFMIMSLLIGELGWFGAPDFSNHEWVQFARFANISSIVIISTVFIAFILRLNKSSERALSDALEEVTSQSIELEQAKNGLESMVLARTSQLKEQRDQLREQNEEKVVLLQEVHHRVQNNLQIIVSLINLQLKGIQDDDTELALREIQSRVESMAMVHQNMYQSTKFKEISMLEYTKQIIDNISRLYGEKDLKYAVEIPESLTMNLEEAIPTGLIVNEIISNFFKHGRCEGTCTFSVSVVVNDGHYELTYRDRGNGFDQIPEIGELHSLGLQLISNLTEQLDGEFELDSDEGAIYKLRIPLSN